MEQVKSGMKSARPPLRSSLSLSGRHPDTTSPLSIAVPGRNSPKAWEETLHDISLGLQLICGSPPPVSGSPINQFLQSGGSSQSSPACADSISPLQTSLPPRRVAFRQHHTKELRRADSVQSYEPPRTVASVPKSIFVRHIETQEELKNRLFEICRSGSYSNSMDGQETSPKREEEGGTTSPSDEEKRGEGLEASSKEEGTEDKEERSPSEEKGDTGRKYSDLGSIRARINVKAFSSDVEDLIVCVRNRNRLTVETTTSGSSFASGFISGSGSGSKVVHESRLADGSQVNRLLGQLSGDGQLTVRERPSTMVDVAFVGTGSTFIPVLKYEETMLELTLVLHIPNDFRFEDVNVKTIDDRVVIIGKKRSVSLPQGGALDFRSAGSSSSVLPSFRVMVQLPEGTDSRSVCASMTGHQQLIISGKLASAKSRRYSF